MKTYADLKHCFEAFFFYASLLFRAVDPHSFYADPDPDPAVFLNTDPDPDPDPDPGLGPA